VRVRHREAIEGISFIGKHRIRIEIHVQTQFLLIGDKLRGGNPEARRCFVNRSKCEADERVEMLGDGVGSADDVAVEKLTGAGSELQAHKTAPGMILPGLEAALLGRVRAALRAHSEGGRQTRQMRAESYSSHELWCCAPEVSRVQDIGIVCVVRG